MATWADRFDHARRYNIERQRQDEELARTRGRENALNQIFAESVDPSTGQLNLRNALSKAYASGLVDNPVQTEMNIVNADLRRTQLGQRPSAIQVYEYWKNLDGPKAQQDMLNTMRQNFDVTKIGNVPTMVTKGPAPAVTPLSTLSAEVSGESAVAGGKSRAAKIGTEMGEQEVSLAEMQANLPRLEAVVTQLSELGKNATYTKKGQFYDAMRREAGMTPRESSIARKEYIAKVDNEVLPLLRVTFGAQFTENEGKSLKVTLGDPDASPEEKDAVLRSFIDSKRAQVETQKRKLGADIPGPAVNPAKVKVGSVVEHKGKRYRVLSVTKDGKPDDVELIK